MCNPRRVLVTATQALDEAWQREVTRAIELSGMAVGEARVRQTLDDSLGGPALQALELALGDPASGWQAVEGGFRRDVEGGYVVYHVDERELEIVAVLCGEVRATGTVSQQLTGHVRDELTVEGQGVYYDDGWGQRTEETARQQAETDAQRKLDEARRSRLLAAQQDAEQSVEAQLAEAAREQATAALERERAAAQAELAAAARDRLQQVGARCRQAFHAVLARAYRDAILAYARSHSASDIQCQEDGQTIEIEFLVRR